MDCAEIKVEMAEEGLPRRLHITEERDTAEGVAAKDADITSAFTVKSYSEHSALKKEEEHTEVEDKKEEDATSEMCLEEQSLGNQQEAKAEDFKERGGKPEDSENMSEGQSADDSKSDKQTLETMRINEKPSKTEDEKVKENNPQVDVQSLNSSEQQPEGDTNKAHRLTPDFPESLYELLCTLQEGRRLNDQRCSFSLEAGGLRRRRCHSEPNTGKPAHRVVFSSMTSLQKEEFFELVATSQARRLDDQRAQLERSPPTKTKGRSFRGSLKQLSFVRRPVSVPAPAPAQAPVPKEDLYNMILTTQAQGRLEDQRSRAPGPMDDEDFFSLLLRVQGGRMEEQRTELPCLLQT
ncbi:G-protein-signaling modulator 1 [Notolabrus celidotus]|uniref:G-protein-signaling modulator 1 n=1 Tax=Notolabrus celidotus TaxID=1203425 RepID=UPI0014901F74|nr:G-protein-signaling modulator 1 [Notolabrus celidotus]XP_034553331.1 G-protein-signaling modulator 1 [Notolabrus celidotus]XP_034553332.1 G-protein-signaling modulator 1 [Notolabrus celidotus]